MTGAIHHIMNSILSFSLPDAEIGIPVDVELPTPDYGVKVSKLLLGSLTYLGEGGFSKVFRVPGFFLPDDPVPLAYKEFTRDQAVQARSVRAAIAFRTQGVARRSRPCLPRT
jgi:hypothetical protein